MSDMSRLETKMERLSDQLSIKEREMQTMASKVTDQNVYTSSHLLSSERNPLSVAWDLHEWLHPELQCDTSIDQGTYKS
jgi:hypothetical protein